MLYKIAMVVVEWMARLKMKFFHLGSFHLGPPILQAKVAALLLRADVSFPICISTSNTSPPLSLLACQLDKNREDIFASFLFSWHQPISLSAKQCDHIWRNFATLATHITTLAKLGWFS